MTKMTRVKQALLELGLEDFIPLAEAVFDPEVLAEIRKGRPVDTISLALVDLLRNELIQVWTGHWQDEPTLVGREIAESLLLDEDRYSFDTEVDGRERVYYVNVKNIRG
ncbi:MAG: hypothetical protein CVT64_06950 [Actinobacteria bacterium HGW-Actinobacteria-4]|nr:MAG: hypothetical protein CVT64_06950 [Actinobacteria bacterium HGW-Actinobacteria-4]